MDQHYWAHLIDHLMKYGIEFESGLTDQEFEAIESKYQFKFPPDLRQFLQIALPVSHRFPNWRKNCGEVFRQDKEWILAGINFDIERNNFWWGGWGEKPENLFEAFQIAEREIAKAPVMIPVYSHRFIPVEPNLSGNPIFSIYQTDIIYYGYDLASYYIQEFSTMRLEPQTGQQKRLVQLDFGVN